MPQFIPDGILISIFDPVDRFGSNLVVKHDARCHDDVTSSMKMGTGLCILELSSRHTDNMKLTSSFRYLIISIK